MDEYKQGKEDEREFILDWLADNEYDLTHGSMLGPNSVQKIINWLEAR